MQQTLTGCTLCFPPHLGRIRTGFREMLKNAVIGMRHLVGVKAHNGSACADINPTRAKSTIESSSNCS